MATTKPKARGRKKTQAKAPVDGRRRVVIEGVVPEIDGGRFPIKRVVGDAVVVGADVFADGHDSLACRLLYRREADAEWSEAPMQALVNDRWHGGFRVDALGRWRYTLVAWVDPWTTWRRDLQKRLTARQDVTVDLRIGAELVRAAAERAEEEAAAALEQVAIHLENPYEPGAELVGLPDWLDDLMERHADRSHATTYAPELGVIVDRERARFSAWYEMFPRSCAGGGSAEEPQPHATFRDCEERLPYVAGLGFDVLYLPPIHPIGRSHRKGRNNNPVAEPGEIGSPWAIGSEEGGHKAVHPDLGTLDDFRRFAERAGELGLEIALDVAFQCSPDHPYVREHPEWFKRRPDGTIQYAENPPKKYEDIVPFDFECEDWWGLWQELKSVFDFWIEQGVRTFRVDNPHTKPFLFWEWLVGELKAAHPEVILLSEAFTRPKPMYQLAKLGFSQSYTYFAWRTTKWELEQYFTELTTTVVREFFRPNVWPNTPDILTEQLQFGGRPAFLQRLVLAGTLSASYGIYGPAFELGEHVARERGSEEYWDSEKYQLRRWDLDRPGSLAEAIALLNRVRRENPALQTNEGLRFHATDNEQVLCYSKATPDRGNVILVIVNLDPHHAQGATVDLPLGELGIEDPAHPFQVHDLLTGARYLWHGPRNFVHLDPHGVPAHVFRLRHRIRSERDFDYFV
ncbi:MAG TPA: alpha-1,4-glucan--maltose-1-phosphate maltosyltransferase [Thermoanaerobaculia bacterium]|nr:alpha-1,4-glucan--maltose-1-phosphate maltosyltransferase [Thermoanaerobaculia bacterium]